ncbi:hypothetical protein A7U60_g5095 [Sanghuangporus baumii]|uniref:Uncharacterized protein n=1 Tax=Sanghuangporus baumii TaxID=108892 RepID=A0A9Q5HXY2_SANBA|nr:hypothetical protein A7U60_g5095 [Sanghuangporus baumii]
MLARTAFLLAALAASVSAQLTILSPGGSDLWWAVLMDDFECHVVANSENNIVWTCDTSPVQNFTILVANSDQSVLVSPLAVVAVQQNFDCSRTLTTQQVNFTTGTGYSVILADPINSTNVYAQSEEFEIKPVGSTYPDPSSTPTGTASASATGSGSATASGNEAAASDNAAVVQVASPKALGTLLVGALAMLAL